MQEGPVLFSLSILFPQNYKRHNRCHNNNQRQYEQHKRNKRREPGDHLSFLFSHAHHSILFYQNSTLFAHCQIGKTNKRRAGAFFASVLRLFCQVDLPHRRPIPLSQGVEDLLVELAAGVDEGAAVVHQQRHLQRLLAVRIKGHRHVQHVGVEREVVGVVHRLDTDGRHVRATLLQLQQLVGHIHRQ